MKSRIIAVLITLAIGLLAVTFTVDAQSTNAVLDFYCERAAGQINSRNPNDAGLSYRINLRAYLSRLGSGGKPELTDSAIYVEYYTFGEEDSQRVDLSTSDHLTDIDLTYPNIFERNYDFEFYPNDTGGSRLAIGFASDTLRNLSPVGLAVIDRTRYFLHQLYLYYPKTDEYERYSRTLSFRELDGFIFPDTITTTYSQAGIFHVEHYRIDAYIDSVAITR